MRGWMHNALGALRTAQAGDPVWAGDGALTAQIDMGGGGWGVVCGGGGYVWGGVCGYYGG